MGRRQPRVACWRGRVGKLKLLCISLAAFGIERAVRRLDILEALSGLRNGSSDSEIIGLSLITNPYLPAGKRKSGFSGRNTSISEPSLRGATLNSYDKLRIVHKSSTSVVLACPVVSKVMARMTLAITRTATRSGALLATSRR